MKPITTDAFKLSAAVRDPKEDTLVRLREGALTWVKQKLTKTFPDSLPPEAWRGETFIGDLPGLKLEAVALPDLWTLRLEHQDAPTHGDAAVPGRTWTTDISIRDGAEVGVAVRLRCTSSARDDEEVPRTCPRVLKMWAREHQLIADGRLVEQAMPVQTREDLETLHHLVSSPSRVLPVVVLSQADKATHRWPVTEWVLDEKRVAKELFGFAYSHLLSREQAFEWTRIVGRPWSVFNGAVRTYLPQLNVDTQSPFDHPMATVDCILAATTENEIQERAFASLLIEQVKRVSTFRFVRWETPFVTEARSIAAENEHKRVLSHIASRDLGHEGEKERLREELSSVLPQVESLKRENAKWVEELEVQRRSMRRSNRRRSGFARRTGSFACNWTSCASASRALEQRLTAHSRCRRTTRSSRSGLMNI